MVTLHEHGGIDLYDYSVAFNTQTTTMLNAVKGNV